MRRRSLFTLTRLSLLGSAGLAACSGGKSVGEGSTSTSKLKTLRVHAPTTPAFMAPMASFGISGKLDDLVGKTGVQNWVSVDVMKSLVVGGETDLVATPSYVTANLFNKGLPVWLVAMAVWGMLYILGPEGSSAQGVEGLKGRKVGVPPPNNMPNLVLCYLMTQNGIPPEGEAEGIEVVPYDQASEPVKVLMSGQAECAVLPEHAATTAQNQAKQSGKNLDRTANLQGVWAKVTGNQARLPMAGAVMPRKLVDSNQTPVAGVFNELEEVVVKVNTLDEKAVAVITAKTEVPEVVAKNVIPRLQPEMMPAQKAKTELEDLYTRLITLSPDIVGSKMSADGFYLADPR